MQVNGKLRDRVEASSDASEEELLALARASEKVQGHIDGKQVVEGGRRARQARQPGGSLAAPPGLVTRILGRSGTNRGVLVRRLAEAPVEEWHKLRTNILMDAGELGSRHMSVTWVEVPPGIDQELHSHEESEQIYVVTKGSGAMTVAGDRQEIGEGDLVLVPPATDHSIANDGDSDLCCVSVQSPAVTVSEVFAPTPAGAAEYDEEDY